MSRQTFSGAFAKFGATLKNVQWSVSSINNNNELVVSLWAHHRDPAIKDAMVFSDSFDRWSGPGNNEFMTNVTRAHQESLPVRLIIVSTEETQRVQSGEDASRVKKRFSPRDDLIGKVMSIDGDRYTIRFVKEAR
ncbi:MAG: hypothetical protein HWE39_10130 [Oceanospirillaceae bacterium]|nr:hypothetical protein [Oceanospirillaceae bacterium]